MMSGESMIPLRLRTLTPEEIVRLHGFPSEGFDYAVHGIYGVADMPGVRFPAHFTNRDRYKLLGNSLNAVVVAHLIRNMCRRDNLHEWSTA